MYSFDCNSNELTRKYYIIIATVTKIVAFLRPGMLLLLMRTIFSHLFLLLVLITRQVLELQTRHGVQNR